MNRTKSLLVVAIGSAIASVGCFGGAYTLAETNKASSGQTSREIPWDGSGSLNLDLPAVVTFVQGGSAPGKVMIRGDGRSVAAITVSEGRVHDKSIHSGAPVQLTITAPAIKSFYLNGRSRLIIEKYDQATLDLRTQGSAEVEASGRAGSVSVEMQGSGSINLSQLAADSVSSSIGGTATLVANPAQSARLEVRNLASVVLLSRPANVSTNLIDSGRVIYASKDKE